MCRQLAGNEFTGADYRRASVIEVGEVEGSGVGGGGDGGGD